MKILNFYFLDRNVIGTIGAILNGTALNDEEWRMRKKVLKARDKKTNFMACLLSSTEGANLSSETPEEKITIIKKESDLIKSFFKEAHTDSKANSNLAKVMSLLNLGKQEHGFENYIKFYKEISPILSQSFSKNTQLSKYSLIKSKILEIAKLNNVPAIHPVVLCSLSVLYNNDYARDVLKFKKNTTDDDAYNAISDIILISRIPRITFIFRTGNFKKCKVKLFTFDKSLKKLYSYFMFNSMTVKPHDEFSVSAEINTNINPEMFPKLEKDQVFKLIEELSPMHNSPMSILAHPVLGNN